MGARGHEIAFGQGQVISPRRHPLPPGAPTSAVRRIELTRVAPFRYAPAAGSVAAPTDNDTAAYGPSMATPWRELGCIG